MDLAAKIDRVLAKIDHQAVLAYSLLLSVAERGECVGDAIAHRVLDLNSKTPEQFEEDVILVSKLPSVVAGIGRLRLVLADVAALPASVDRSDRHAALMEAIDESADLIDRVHSHVFGAPVDDTPVAPAFSLS